MSKANVFLPSYSVGTDCYEEVRYVTRRFGKKAVVIGGKTAMEKGRPALEAALAGTDLTITDFVWYGDNATYANAEALMATPAVQEADMIFGMGGGRAIDTCKVVATRLDKPLFSFPTIASNCAPCTAIAVIYKQDGTLDGYFYPQEPTVHTFINTKIIAEAPEKLLWAGIGDALSKEYEVLLATRDKTLSHTPLLGKQLAGACAEPLLRFGAKALEDCRSNTPSYELEQVALDIVMSTGLVSNFTTTPDADYYNSSLAHAFYNGSTVIPAIERHLHGEVVSFGVLFLMTYDKQYALRDELMAFNQSIGLPICLADLELTPADLAPLAAKAKTVTEWHCAPYELTEEAFIAAALECDEAGKARK